MPLPARPIPDHVTPPMWHCTDMLGEILQRHPDGWRVIGHGPLGPVSMTTAQAKAAFLALYTLHGGKLPGSWSGRTMKARAG